jgi:hypothetical protein
MSNQSNSTVATMSIDIGKNSFHVVGLDPRSVFVQLHLDDLVEAAIDGGKAFVHLFTQAAYLIVHLVAEAADLMHHLFCPFAVRATGVDQPVADRADRRSRCARLLAATVFRAVQTNQDGDFLLLVSFAGNGGVAALAWFLVGLFLQ